MWVAPLDRRDVLATSGLNSLGLVDTTGVGGGGGVEKIEGEVLEISKMPIL